MDATGVEDVFAIQSLHLSASAKDLEADRATHFLLLPLYLFLLSFCEAFQLFRVRVLFCLLA